MPQKSPFFRVSCVNEDTSAKRCVFFARKFPPKAGRTWRKSRLIDLKKLGYEKGLCPNAEKYYNEVMSIPLYYGLTDEDVEDVIHAVKKVVAYYTKLK